MVSAPLPLMEIDEHISVLRDAGERLAAAAAAAGVEADVPTCPGWTVTELLRHIGGVHRWAASYINRARPGPTTDEEDVEFFAAAPDSSLLSWYCQGHAALVETLSRASPDVHCWSFLEAPSPLAFWARRQAHETAIHCADAEAAAGTTTSFAAPFAADGIDELLCGFMMQPGGELVSDVPVVLGVQATDTGDAWTVRIGAERRVVTPDAGRADCLLSGDASDLYLLLWNRIDTSPSITVTGDRRLIELWKAKATVRWS